MYYLWEKERQNFKTYLCFFFVRADLRVGCNCSKIEHCKLFICSVPSLHNGLLIASLSTAAQNLLKTVCIAKHCQYNFLIALTHIWQVSEAWEGKTLAPLWFICLGSFHTRTLRNNLSLDNRWNLKGKWLHLPNLILFASNTTISSEWWGNALQEELINHTGFKRSGISTIPLTVEGHLPALCVRFKCYNL